MFDITFILDDPELGACDFVIRRQVYTRSVGRAVKDSSASEDIPASGNIQPLSMNETQLLPEEYKKKEAIAVYTKAALTLGENFGSSYTLADEIVWNDGVWRLIQLQPWVQHGWRKGIAVRIADYAEK